MHYKITVSSVEPGYISIEGVTDVVTEQFDGLDLVELIVEALSKDMYQCKQCYHYYDDGTGSRLICPKCRASRCT